ncbi:MAG: hypothetical protein AAB686_02550 [Patescibacteria group bacterium]
MFDYPDEESFKDASGYVIDDVWYPRVTKIVSIKAKPALYRYYGEAANFRAAQAVTEQSAKEGTLIHETVEAILLGQKPQIDPSIAPAVNAFANFLEQKNIQVTPELVEKRIISYKHRYAGTTDALALIDGKFGVLDIKTSQAIYRDYNLQTAAYIDALKEQFQNLQTRWILRIDQIQMCLRCAAKRRVKGGREKIRTNGRGGCPEGKHSWSDLIGEVEIKEFPYWQNDFEAFLGAKKLWEWENEYWLKRIGYL